MSPANGKPPLENAKIPVSHDTGTNTDNNEVAFEAGLKALEKTTSNAASNLNVPYTGRRRRSESLDSLSLISADDFSELRRVRSASFAVEDEDQDDDIPDGWSGKIKKSWIRNKGLAWVVMAQAFGVLMNVSTRLLENEENGGMHPFQILFARMSITSTLSMLYMYYTKTPDFPLGAKGVRGILVARGLGGFFGVFGLYWSLQYLPLADATVLTFLAPIIACWVCSKLLHDTFTRVEQIGGLISLAGVVLIARPTAIFSSGSTSTAASASDVDANTTSPVTPRALSGDQEATSAQRLAAVGVAMIGVVGASIAYITIRWIGKRAHPLISVNYFAVWCTIVSSFSLAFIPSIPFVLPATVKQWALLFLIGLGGFVMQFLLTAGLRYEKGSRATNMVYSQMLFALAADKIIWNDTPGPWSLAGSALILGSAIVIAVQKAGATKSKEEERGTTDEEAAIVEGTEGEREDLEMRERDQQVTEDSGSYALERHQSGRLSTESRRSGSADDERARSER